MQLLKTISRFLSNKEENTHKEVGEFDQSPVIHRDAYIARRDRLSQWLDEQRDVSRRPFFVPTRDAEVRPATVDIKRK